MRARGFTLIELLVTISVLGTLATLAAPSFVELLDRRRLVSQAEAMVNLVQQARIEALKHTTVAASRSITLTVNPSSPWYAGLKEGTAACNGTATDCVVNEGGVDVTRLIRGTECSSCTLTAPTSQTSFIFNFRGLVGGASDTAITFQSPRGKQLRVAVSRIGRVSVCSPTSNVTGYSSCPP